MSNRDSKRRIIKNNDPAYRKQFDARGIKEIPSQYATSSYSYPTAVELAQTPLIEESWKIGDRFYKYAKKYYNDESYWWLIAWINKAPTEHHMSIGDKVVIIANLSDAKRLFYGD